MKTSVSKSFKAIKSAIINAGTKFINAYGNVLLGKIVINDHTNWTATRIYRFIMASPILTIIGFILYWLGKGWMFIVGLINAMAWGIGC